MEETVKKRGSGKGPGALDRVVSVKMDAALHARLREQALSRGFSGVSHYMRHLAENGAGGPTPAEEATRRTGELRRAAGYYRQFLETLARLSGTADAEGRPVLNERVTAPLLVAIRKAGDRIVEMAGEGSHREEEDV